MRPITFLLTFFSALFYNQAYGDVTFSISPTSTNAAVGTQVTFTVTVDGFVDLNGFQFPIDYDESKLQFVSGSATPFSSAPNDTTQWLNFTQAGNQWIRANYFYFDISGGPTGRTIPNGTTILTLRFNKIAAGTTDIQFSTTLQPTIQVIDESDALFIIAQGPHSFTASANPPAAPSPLTFIIEKDTISTPGGNTCVTVRAKGFKDIVDFQFGIAYDTTKFVYQSPNPGPGQPSIQLGTALGSNLVINPAIRGQIRALYTAPTSTNGSPLPINIPDSTVLFSICFTARPGQSGLVPLNFSEFQTPSVFTNAFSGLNGPINNTVLTNGHVFINGNVVPVAPLSFMISMDTITAPGGSKCVTVRTKGFTDIVDFQFGIAYDTSKLVYVHPNPGPGQPSIQMGTALGSNLIVTAAIPGQIRALYTAPTSTNGTPLPINVTDSTILFSICFTAKPGQLGLVPINFSEFQTPSLLTNAFNSTTGAVNNAVLVNGSLQINQPVLPPSTPFRLTIENDSAGFSQTVCTDVRAFGWTNMTSATFGISYDTTKLVFSSFAFGSNPLNNPTNFQAVHLANTKQIRLSYTAPPQMNGTPVPSTIPDSTMIFQICFNTKPTVQSGDIAPVVFFAFQTPTVLTEEFVNTSGRIAQYTLTNGSVKIIGPSGNPCAGNNLTIPTGTITQTNVSCLNGNNGRITVAPTGGTAPLTVTWSGPGGYSGTGLTIQGLSAGAYTPTLTDATGCSVIGAAINVTQPSSAVDINVTSTSNVRCFGSSDGSISTSTTGGTPPYSYTWTGGAGSIGNTPNPTNLTIGVYAVTVTDANGCIDWVTNTTIIQPQQLSVTSSAALDVNCPGGSDGFLNISVSGGTGARTYTWMPGGASTQNLANVAAGQYRVTITDANGCSRSFGPYEVKQPTPINIGTPNVTRVRCHNSADGSISITPSGGSGSGYTVTWAPGSLQGATISNLAPGSYTPTVVDGKGCTAFFPAVTVNAPSPIQITGAQVTPQTATPPNGSITITAQGGTGSYTYLWSPNVSNSAIATGLAGGSTYSVTVTDANNCSVSGSYTIQNNAAVANLISVNNACGFSSTGCATISASGLTLPFEVSHGNVNVAITTETFLLCGLPPGNNLVTIRGANNLSATVAVQILNAVPAVVDANVTNVSIDNVGGSIILTPSTQAPGVYVYQWDASAGNSRKDTLLNLDAGIYCVTITNTTSGCTSTKCYEVKYPPAQPGQPVTVNPQCGQSNGSITLSFRGGNGPIYRYIITNAAGAVVLDSTGALTTITATGLPAGVYSARVLDESQVPYNWTPDIVLASTTIQATAAIVSSYQGFGVSSPTACNGAVTVTPTMGTSPFSYMWSTGGGVIVGATNNQLCAGAYTVTVTDASGCSLTLTGTLTAPSAVVVTASAQSQFNGFNVTCNGVCNGIGRVAAAGGVAPYTVAWSNGRTGTLTDNTDIHDVFNLCAGTYTVTVTDALSNTKVGQVVINQPAPIQITVTQVPPARFTACDGFMSASTNGAGAVQFTWAVQGGGSGTGPKVENLCVGKIVSFTAIDANGCTATLRDTVPYPSDGCLEMSPVITPGNQDGKNDALIITCVESISDHSVEIYNRFGQSVFETKSYDNSTNRWEGLNSRGQALPEGVYFVVFTYRNDLGETIVKKTYVNLLRS